MATFNSGKSFGTNAADIFNGSHLDDVFFALKGNDTLKGEGGEDTLYGYQGNDSIEGGAGDDSLYGDEDRDNLKGGTGNDLLSGGSGDDRLLGESSFSTIAIDTLRGGEGADLFSLGDYHDNLYRNSGNEDYALIKDLQAEDTIRLDYGSYTFEASPIEGIEGTGIYEGRELIAVLAGVDTANLSTSTSDNGYYTHITGYRSPEIYGTEEDDSLIGESSDDIIYGLEGDDTLQGSRGSTSNELDQFIGGQGADLFVLGNFHGNYYSNGGAKDYALIKDLQLNDTIRLDRGNYEFAPSTIEGVEGTAIYEDEELIAIVEGAEAEYLTTSTSDNGYYTHISSNSAIIEAEDLNLKTYTVQNFGELPAEDGKFGADAVGITLYDGEIKSEAGTASLLASDYGLSGTYDLSVSYFDENDGIAALQVLVNDEAIDEILFSEETSSGYPTEDTRREYTFEDLAIESTDTVAIRGVADINTQGSEWARVDYIGFALDTEVNDLTTSDI